MSRIGSCTWSSLGQSLNLLVDIFMLARVSIDDISESHTFQLHVRQVQTPLVEGGAEGDGAVFNLDLPIFLVLRRSILLDEIVNPRDDLREFPLNIIRQSALSP